MADYVCNACGFRVPAGDQIGVAIMFQHLEDEHGLGGADLDESPASSGTAPYDGVH